jgi:hypothetical protein
MSPYRFLSRPSPTSLCLRALLAALAIASTSTLEAAVTPEEAAQIAERAYIYGYPLVTMEFTRRVMTNAEHPGDNHAPMGQFYRAATYPNAQFRDVTAPNADTLYSVAWLDLTHGPYVFSLPDQGDRYYLMPMLDAWTNVFTVPGKRTTGDGAQTYAITGPGWRGQLPAGVKQLAAPTNLIWILGRTYCTGTPEDYQAVHALQAQYKLVPLAEYGKPYTPPAGKVDPSVDMKTAVREQVNRLSAQEYFSLLAKLMKDNPPAKEDAPIIAEMAKLGIAPGQPVDLAKLGQDVNERLAKVPAAAFGKIMGHFRSAGQDENGWVFTTQTGLYGTDYLQRALITAIGLGANRPQDAVYPTSEVDSQGQPYSGANRYVVHFANGETPPAEAFWSITMYNSEYFFVDNPLNKYTVSPRNELKYNGDGSLDLYIQRDDPGPEKQANWLPAPEGKFILMLRMYWPREKAPSILDNTWKIPPVTKVN